MNNTKRAINIYNEEIVPKIRGLDYLLKTNKELSITETSEILEIPEKELLNILEKLTIKYINKSTIIRIMLAGDSLICRVMKREIELGSPYFYTPKDIAYIYDVDYIKVKKAYEFLEIKRVLASEIPIILMQL